MKRNFQSIVLIVVFSCGLFAQGNVLQINSPTTGELVSTSYLPIDYSLAGYFDIGDSACTNCDGFIRVTLNYAYAGLFNSVGADTLQDVTNGQYLLGLEAVDPSGNSFDPQVMDTVTFTIVGNPELCAPGGLIAYPGDGRNVLSWNEPFSTSSANPFPATPNSAEYNTGSTDGSSLTEASEIKGYGGPADSRESGWVRFSLLGLSPAIQVDSVVFNYYVNDTNWPYWSVTPVSVDPLTADEATLHADINGEASSPTEAYLYQFEASTFAPGFYSNTLINNAAQDVVDAIQDGYFAVGVVDRDFSTTYYLEIDGWNDENPPSLDVYWSAPGGRQFVFNTPAISNNIENHFTLEEIDQYKNAVSNGELYPEYLTAISNYEIERYPLPFSRDVGIVCGTFQNYKIYNGQTNTVIATPDTNYWVHDNLTNNTSYCYYVSAVYNEGESDTTETVCATPETYVPDPVTNLAASGLDEEALIYWTSPDAPDYVYYTSFEDSAASGFVGVGGFQIGTPNYDSGPEVASGANCWATNLNGVYDNTAYASLTSPVFNISDLSNPMLQINHWYQIESYWDGGNVKMSADSGATWSILLPEEDYPEDAVYTGNTGIPGEQAYSGTLNGNFWHTVQFTIDSLSDADTLVQFRFDFGSDGSVQYAGWYIDDFALMDNSENRDIDGELNQYKVYQDGTLLDSTSETSYMATGLTNNQEYTFGVSASYYPNFESTIENVTVTPTWMYGDISGVISDPNGDPLDSAVVSVGSLSDTTGTDGLYILRDLDPGLHNIVVTHPSFDNNNADVTAIAQEDAVVQNFTLNPKLGRPGSLEADGFGQNVYLTWRTAGSMEIGCGDKLIPSLPFSDQGTNLGMGDDWDVAGGDGEDYAYTFYVFEDMTITVDLCSPITDYDAKLEVFTADELCVYTSTGYYNDDGPFGTCPDSPAPFTPSLLENIMLTEGVYYIVVDGFGGDTGNFEISVTEAVGGRGFMTDQHMLDISLEEQKHISRGVSSMDARTYVSDLKEIYFDNNFQLSSNNNDSDARSVSLRTSINDSLTGYNIYQALGSGDTLVLATYGEDTTAIIPVPENYVEYCYYVKARWSTDYGELESKATPIACTTPYLGGDVNSDDVVDVNDLLSVVDFILQTELPTELQFRNSDLNRDGFLNVADIIMMIDIIYGSSARTLPSSLESIAEISMRNGGGTSLLLDLAYDGFIRGVQFDLTADLSDVMFGSAMLNELQEGVMINSHTLEDGTTRVLAVNLNGGLVPFSSDGFITIPVTMNTGRGDRVKVGIQDIQLIDQNGESIPVNAKGDGSVALELIPMKYALYQNFPNPFNPVTEIQFDIPDISTVELVVYNLMGQEVRRLVNGEIQAGYHRIVWDGLNDQGEPVSTGVYIYSLTSPGFHSTKKMVLLK